MAKIAGHEYFTLEEADLHRLVSDRIKELEAQRLVRVVTLVEIEAVHPMVDKEGADTYLKDHAATERQVKEIDLRIEALRGLSPEFTEPKV